MRGLHIKNFCAIAIAAAFAILPLCAFACPSKSANGDALLKKYSEDIVGTWVSGESMYIVTPKYVLYIPGKKASYTCNRYISGKLSPCKITPSKHFYAISKEGGYIFRAMRWYRIEGQGKDMRLDNRKFLIYLGGIKIFSFDGGGVLNKISDEETISRLNDYDLDFDIIRKLPIETHQDVSDNASFVFDTEPDTRDSRGFKTSAADNSLPSVIEAFLTNRQNKK